MSELRTRDWVGLAVWVLICEGAGGISGVLTASAIRDWYPTLTKPVFNPPNWVFGPVWTTLFALMGIAAWFAWRTPPSKARSLGLRLFWAQLALNVLWSLIFFRGHALLGAAVEVVLLLAAIVSTTVVFRRVSTAAALLMVPYALWVGFATLLTWAIWRLNV